MVDSRVDTLHTACNHLTILNVLRLKLNWINSTDHHEKKNKQ